LTPHSTDETSQIILVLGGARSGKSTFAEQLAARSGGAVLFVATAEALDDEMAERIAKHRADRPIHWVTIEVPRNLGHALVTLPAPPHVVLLDCLTLWVTNELLATENGVEQHLSTQLEEIVAWARARCLRLIIVSNEVGLGIVPENVLARRFRDVLGRLNAQAAQSADQVYWMVAGLPIEVQALAQRKE
jgi:adenosylcobinamide kinase/adenosylcobinamide-phosphate guanylyltransferase